MNALDRVGYRIKLVEATSGAFAFLLIFPLDAVFYYAKDRWVGLPVGFVGALLMLSVLCWKTFKGYRELMPLPSGSVFFAGYFVSALLCAISSPYFTASSFLPLLWQIVYYVLGLSFVDVVKMEIPLQKWSTYVFIGVSTALILSIDLSARTLVYHDEHINYIRIASGYAMCSLLVISCQSELKWKLVVYFVGAIVLFVIQSRMWFFLWLLYPVMFSGLLKQHFWKAITLAAAVVMIVGCIALLFKDDPNFRMVRLLLNVSHDTSLLGRLAYLKKGFDQIISHPILGYHRGYLEYAEEGGYIHNILSYWHSYGVVSFAILIGFLAGAVRNLFSCKLTGWQFDFAKLVVVYGVLSSVVSRSNETPDVFFALGLSSSVLAFGNGSVNMEGGKCA
ncbi:MAG: O-antigen ligase family protein [Fibrobacteres bacterium]|nr:O-antigen ligase family protein [Fibrobacterota bacterium]